MYQIIVGIVFLLVLIIIWRTGKKSGVGFSLILNRISTQWNKSYQQLSEIKTDKSPVFQILGNFFLVLTSVFFIIMAITGFLPVLLFGAHLSGVLLIIHVTTAPLFVLSFMFLLVFRAHKNQFSQNDFKYLNERWVKKTVATDQQSAEQFMQKLWFWLFGVFSLPAILSMVLSMYPLFGTGWQVAMLNLHQFSVLILMVVAVFYLKSKYLSVTA